MPIERERRFLVADIDAATAVYLNKLHIVQRYLTDTPEKVIRLRHVKDTNGVSESFITVKGKRVSGAAVEKESKVDNKFAINTMVAFGLHQGIGKTRYVTLYAGRVWEVDVFLGNFQGLVLAEVELPEQGADDIELPPWVGEEITNDHRYSNLSLSRYGLPA